jgi:hypothetical protein
MVKYQKINIALVSFPILFGASMAIAAPNLSSTSKAQIDGVGAMRVGMTVKQAAQAAGVKLVPSYDDRNNECRYVQPQAGVKHLSLMVSKDRIVRIDINPGSSIKTLKGAGIGCIQGGLRCRHITIQMVIISPLCQPIDPIKDIGSCLKLMVAKY